LLHIEARKEKHTGPDGARDYTSARIRTKNKADWKFGRIEVRAKLPRGKGIWPASAIWGARLTPKIEMSAPGATSAVKLAALTMPPEFTTGV